MGNAAESQNGSNDSAGRHRPQRAGPPRSPCTTRSESSAGAESPPSGARRLADGHLPKGDARRALAWMNPTPVRREWRRVRGEVAACSTAGTDNLRRHRTTAVLRPRGNAAKFAIMDLHDLVRAPGRCPNVEVIDVRTAAGCCETRSVEPRRPDLRPMGPRPGVLAAPRAVPKAPARPPAATRRRPLVGRAWSAKTSRLCCTRTSVVAFVRVFGVVLTLRGSRPEGALELGGVAPQSEHGGGSGDGGGCRSRLCCMRRLRHAHGAILVALATGPSSESPSSIALREVPDPPVCERHWEDFCTGRRFRSGGAWTARRTAR